MTKEFERATLAAQLLLGNLILLDDGIDKRQVVRVLAAMVGASDFEPLSDDERERVTAVLTALYRKAN